MFSFSFSLDPAVSGHRKAHMDGDAHKELIKALPSLLS